MTARDDYPVLAALAALPDDVLPLIDLGAVGDFREALDELDRLRARIEVLDDAVDYWGIDLDNHQCAHKRAAGRCDACDALIRTWEGEHPGQEMTMQDAVSILQGHLGSKLGER